jgi:hypothetical protein
MVRRFGDFAGTTVMDIALDGLPGFRFAATFVSASTMGLPLTATPNNIVLAC